MAAFDCQLLDFIEQRRHTEALGVLNNLSDPGRLVDSWGRTLLHFAAESGNDVIAKYLIESGTDIDAQDCYGKTPLMLYRKSYFDLKVCQILLNAKANIYICDADGKCAFQLLPERMRERIVYRLSELCSEDTSKIAAKLIDWQSSIFCTLGLKNAELTRILLARGCPVESSDSANSWPTTTTLVQAVLFGYAENVRVLLDHGVDVNAVCVSYGCTALTVSGRIVRDSQTREILRLLLDRGANPTQIIGSGILRGKMQMYAILGSGEREIVQILLDRGIDMYAQDANGCSAVHYMAGNTRPAVISELEGRKYDVNARDKSGKIPLHYVRATDLTTANFLLDQGANVNAKDVHGITPLMKIWLAIDANDFRRQLDMSNRVKHEKVKRLIDCFLRHGADPQARTASQEYPIFSIVEGEFGLYWMQSVLAHVALLEARGKLIEPVIRNKINEHTLLREHFEVCKQQLEDMKQVRVWKSMTLYKLMIVNQQKLECYARNEKLLLNLHRMKNKNKYMPYYIYVLRDRTANAACMSRMRTSCAAILCEIIGWYPNSFGVVIQKVIGYLNKSELLKICCEA